jgi:hypothetical protein
MVLPVSIYSVGQDPAVLDVLMIGVIGSRDFELVVVKQTGGRIGFRK